MDYMAVDKANVILNQCLNEVQAPVTSAGASSVLNLAFQVALLYQLEQLNFWLAEIHLAIKERI